MMPFVFFIYEAFFSIGWISSLLEHICILNGLFSEFHLHVVVFIKKTLRLFLVAEIYKSFLDILEKIKELTEIP